jgi:hypothetical protein
MAVGDNDLPASRGLYPSEVQPQCGEGGGECLSELTDSLAVQLRSRFGRPRSPAGRHGSLAVKHGSLTVRHGPVARTRRCLLI